MARMSKKTKNLLLKTVVMLAIFGVAFFFGMSVGNDKHTRADNNTVVLRNLNSTATKDESIKKVDKTLSGKPLTSGNLIISGSVTDLDAKNLTIKTETGKLFRVNVSSETPVSIVAAPSKKLVVTKVRPDKAKKITVKDLKNGQTVSAMVSLDNNGDFKVRVIRVYEAQKTGSNTSTQ